MESGKLAIFAHDPADPGQSRSCQLLELSRIAAFQEGIGTLLKIDAFAQKALCQPVVLAEADPY
jgi:hypothetical protein